MRSTATPLAARSLMNVAQELAYAGLARETGQKRGLKADALRDAQIDVGERTEVDEFCERLLIR